MTPQQEVERIRKRLGHLSMEAKPVSYLKTGIPELNAVLGSPDRGIPYGRIYEISGWEGHGKSALALCLTALAQKDGAEAILGDFECSYDPRWVAARGVDVNKLHLLQPYVGTFGKEKTLRLCTAEELCSEIEAAMDRINRRGNKQILMIDSVAAMMPEDEASVGLEDRNMRTKMSLSVFLSSLLRRWVGLAHSYSAMIVFVNQLREKPMAFGDPAYTPGGKALKFYSHVRVRVNKTKGGNIRGKARGGVIGVQGIMTNTKNKVGGVQGTKVGYKLMFNGPVQFLDAEDMKREDGSE